MRYRRADVTGGTYFFTVNLTERKSMLLVDHIDILRAVIQKVKSIHPFRIDAMVILPDHLHALWTLPVGDCNFPTRWMLIKLGSRGKYRKMNGAAKAGRRKANEASGNGGDGTVVSYSEGNKCFVTKFTDFFLSRVQIPYST